MKNYLFILIFISIFPIGCVTGRENYIKPSLDININNEVIVNKSKEQVWSNIIPKLGKKYFVINNLEKASGLINISYAGDPEKYVDCGILEYAVRNTGGEKTYKFAAAISNMEYEQLKDGNLYYINRKMDLKGRMNLVFEEIEVNKTRVSANTKYILTETLNVQAYNRQVFAPSIETIGFNTGHSGEFTGGIFCKPNGKFEEDVLSLIK